MHVTRPQRSVLLQLHKIVEVLILCLGEAPVQTHEVHTLQVSHPPAGLAATYVPYLRLSLARRIVKVARGSAK